MKKNVLKLKVAIVLIALFTITILGCKKNNSPIVTEPTGTETGKYSLSINGAAYLGNVYSQSSYSATNAFTGEPALEVFLSGDNSQLSFMLQNPTVGTAISCGQNNDANTANIAIANDPINKMYTSGSTGNVLVTLSELTTTKAVGTFTGTVKNLEDIDGTAATITNGTFSVNF